MVTRFFWPPETPRLMALPTCRHRPRVLQPMTVTLMQTDQREQPAKLANTEHFLSRVLTCSAQLQTAAVSRMHHSQGVTPQCLQQQVP